MLKRTIIAILSLLDLAPAFAANSFPAEPSIEVHFIGAKGSVYTHQIGRHEMKKVQLDGIEYTIKANGAKENGDIDVAVEPKDQAKGVRITIKDPA